MFILKTLANTVSANLLSCRFFQTGLTTDVLKK